MKILLVTPFFNALLARILGFMVLTSLMLSTQVQAIDNWEYKLDLDYGMRSDQLNWNIAGTLAGTGHRPVAADRMSVGAGLLRLKNSNFHSLIQ